MQMPLIQKAVDHVRERFDDVHPGFAMILGSGWGVVVDAFEVRRTLDYHDIPGYGGTQVEGHAGRMILASHRGHDLIIFQGRRHWYEGAGWEPIAIPVAIAKDLGVHTLVLTNAAGGIRSDLRPGCLMVIDDHINAMGANPLMGGHEAFWGARFPDMSAVYHPDLRRQFDEAAHRSGQPVAHGVYLATSGPTYETPAEIRAFQRLGADAVGMSTVPEAVLANAAGIRVAGLSCITNCAAGVSDAPLAHSEVIEESRRAQTRMRALLAALFDELIRPGRPAP